VHDLQELVTFHLRVTLVQDRRARGGASLRDGHGRPDGLVVPVGPRQDDPLGPSCLHEQPVAVPVGEGPELAPFAEEVQAHAEAGAGDAGVERDGLGRGSGRSGCAHQESGGGRDEGCATACGGTCVDGHERLLEIGPRGPVLALLTRQNLRASG
jgi:hypothetical protein